MDVNSSRLLAKVSGRPLADDAWDRVKSAEAKAGGRSLPKGMKDAYAVMNQFIIGESEGGNIYLMLAGKCAGPEKFSDSIGIRVSMFYQTSGSEYESEEEAFEKLIGDLKLIGFGEWLESATSKQDFLTRIIPLIMDWINKETMSIRFNTSGRANKNGEYRAFVAGLAPEDFVPPDNLNLAKENEHATEGYTEQQAASPPSAPQPLDNALLGARFLAPQPPAAATPPQPVSTPKPPQAAPKAQTASKAPVKATTAAPTKPTGGSPSQKKTGPKPPFQPAVVAPTAPPSAPGKQPVSGIGTTGFHRAAGPKATPPVPPAPKTYEPPYAIGTPVVTTGMDGDWNDIPGIVARYPDTMGESNPSCVVRFDANGSEYELAFANLVPAPIPEVGSDESAGLEIGQSVQTEPNYFGDGASYPGTVTGIEADGALVDFGSGQVRIVAFESLQAV